MPVCVPITCLPPCLQNAAARKQGRLAPSAKREIADFRDEAHQEAWDVVALGPPVAGAWRKQRNATTSCNCAVGCEGPAAHTVPARLPRLSSLTCRTVSPPSPLNPAEDPDQNSAQRRARRRAADRARARDIAEAYINEDDNLVFEGALCCIIQYVVGQLSTSSSSSASHHSGIFDFSPTPRRQPGFRRCPASAALV